MEVQIGGNAALSAVETYASLLQLIQLGGLVCIVFTAKMVFGQRAERERAPRGGGMPFGVRLRVLRNVVRVYFVLHQPVFRACRLRVHFQEHVRQHTAGIAGCPHSAQC